MFLQAPDWVWLSTYFSCMHTDRKRKDIITENRKKCNGFYKQSENSSKFPILRSKFYKFHKKAGKIIVFLKDSRILARSFDMGCHIMNLFFDAKNKRYCHFSIKSINLFRCVPKILFPCRAKHSVRDKFPFALQDKYGMLMPNIR